MIRYLLDTNIVSDMVRQPAGAVARRIADVGEETVCTSIIVVAELRYGAAKKGSERLTGQLEAVLTALQILPWEEPADVEYGLLRMMLERVGRPIGGNDMLIAAHARALQLTVVTDNEHEFNRIDGLPVENWLRESRAGEGP